jgi:hypothetical protein
MTGAIDALNSEGLAGDRPALQTIRVMFWYWFCVSATGLHHPAQLQDRLDLKDRGNGKKTARSRSGKWRHYVNGQTTPRADLVQRVNQKVAGSAALFDHVLWEIADITEAPLEHSDKWIAKLAPKVRDILTGRSKDESGKYRRSRRKSISDADISKLKKVADLDSLAGLTLLLREALAAGDQKRAFGLVPPILRVLIVLEAEMQQSLRALLFRYYTAHVLSLVRWNGVEYLLEDYDLELTLIFLRKAVLDVLPSALLPESQDRVVQAMLFVLDGKWGRHWPAAFMPIYRADSTGIPSDESLGICKRREIVHARAWAILVQGNQFKLEHTRIEQELGPSAFGPPATTWSPAELADLPAEEPDSVQEAAEVIATQALITARPPSLGGGQPIELKQPHSNRFTREDLEKMGIVLPQRKDLSE